jgi:hypothetical protein
VTDPAPELPTRHYIPGQGAGRTHDGLMVDCPSVGCQEVTQVEIAYQAKRVGTASADQNALVEAAGRLKRAALSNARQQVEPQINAAGYRVHMTDGSDYVWDGSSTAYVDGMAFLCSPQGTHLNPAHVVTITPIDAP